MRHWVARLKTALAQMSEDLIAIQDSITKIVLTLGVLALLVHHLLKLVIGLF